MFDTLPISHLESMLDHFPVPMLIAERPDAITEFRIVAMNSALEELAGPSCSLCGTNLREVFSSPLVDDVVQSFHLCGTTQKTHKFTSAICGTTRQIPCELTLQYLRSPDGYDRIIATAHQTHVPDYLLQDKIAFEDVRYFSFIADLQLENLNSAFVSAKEQIAVTPIDEDRIMRLHAVCRTIQSTVSDIKKVVQEAQARHAAKATVHFGKQQVPSEHTELQQGMGTFNALTGNSACEKQGQGQKVN